MTRPSDTPMHKLWLSVFLLVALIVAGALGLMLLGDRGLFEAVYLTVVILTTVGMEGPNSDAERAWSLFLMIAGVGTVIYATGQVVAFFVEGQVRDIFGRHKVQSKINHLSGHTIVVGFGRMGQALCASMHAGDRAFVLIESDPDRAEQAHGLGYLVVTGDALAEQSLMTAGIDRAAGMATCLPRDANNVYVTLSASGMNPKLHIVARAEDAKAWVKLQRAGAHRVVCPPQIGAVRASDLLQHPDVDDLIELDGQWPDLEMAQISSARFPFMTGLTVLALCARMGKEVSMVAMTTASGDRKMRPDMDTVIGPGDHLVLVGPKGWMNALSQAPREAA